MEQKNLTIFIMSQDGETSRKIVIKNSWIRIAATFGIIVCLIGFALVIDYTGLLAQTSENKKLRTENAQLNKQFQVVEGKVSALETGLERVKTFTTKLKLITNIDTEDRSMKLTMGAQPQAGEQVEEYNEPMDARMTPDQIKNEEVPFTQPKPVNTEKGEVSVENASKDYATLAIRIDRSIRETQLREQSVLDLWESLSERQSLLNSTPNIKPAKGWFTSRFGYRVSPFTGKAAFHAGLDIAAAPGSPVYAPADGVVAFAGFDDSYGKLVSIDHGFGVSTRFGHNSQLYVQVGQKVSRWDVISSVGNTGRSTGPHLHYEVRVNGVPRDPSIYILDE